MKENNNVKYCPYCGSEIPVRHGLVIECDCGHAFYHTHALTAAQCKRNDKVNPMWATIATVITALCAAAAVYNAWPVVESWQGLFLGICLASLAAFIVTLLGWAITRALFGHIAARLIDKFGIGMLYIVAATGFWPFLSFVLYVL